MIGILRNRPQLRQIVVNGGWMVGEQSLKLVGGLLIGVMIARHLGVERFGELGFTIAYTGIFGILGTLGLNRIGLRELVACGGDRVAVRRLEDTILVMRLLGGMALMFLSVSLSWLIGLGDLRMIAIMSPALLFMAFDVIELHFQSRTEAKKSSSARSLSYITVMGLRAIMLLLNADLIAFVVAAMLEYFGAAVALVLVFLRDRNALYTATFDRSLAVALISESWPEVLAGFAGILFVRLDQVMLGVINGPHDVGIFAVASRLSEAWYFIPIAIVTSTFPNIVRLRETHGEEYIQRIGHLMRALVLISYAAIAVVTCTSHWLVVKLYGVQYAMSANVLVIHIWCGLFMSLGLASGSWIMAEKRVKLNLYRNLCGALVNILLNILLIPTYGPIGASIATLCSLIVAYMLYDFVVPAMHGISMRKWRALLLLP